MGMFAAQIRTWVDKTKGDADKVVRYALMTLDSRLINRSPVGDGSYWKRPPPAGYAGGRFRGAWLVSEWTPQISGAGLDRVSSGGKGIIDKDGSATLAAHAGVINAAKAGSVYYLYNPMPYAQRIEKGWSRQAPIGVVALTVVEWNNIVENAVNGVKAGGGDMKAGFAAYPL